MLWAPDLMIEVMLALLERIAVGIESIAGSLKECASPDGLLSVADVASILHISDDKVREHIRTGRLRSYNLNYGGSRPHILIKRAAVYEFLETLVDAPSTHRKIKAGRRFDPGDWAV